MSYIAILKRAARIVLRRPSLWLLGLLPALLALGSLALSALLPALLPLIGSGPWLAWAPPLAAVLGLCWGALSLLGGALAQAGLIALVSEAAQTGSARLSTGLREGWRRGLPLLFTTLLTGALLALAALLVLGLLSLPALLLLALGATQNSWPAGAGVLAALPVIALQILLSAALLALGIVTGILLEIACRRCVLEREGPLTALRSAARLLRTRWRVALFTWLSLLAVSFALTLAGAPLGLAALALAATLAALLAALVHPLAAALLVGVPGLLLAGVILTFLTTAHILYHSTVWTLAYGRLTMEKER